jgi:hypothetical protein
MKNWIPVFALALTIASSNIAIAQRTQFLRPLSETPNANSISEITVRDTRALPTACTATTPAFPRAELVRGNTASLEWAVRVDKRVA